MSKYDDVWGWQSNGQAEEVTDRPVAVPGVYEYTVASVAGDIYAGGPKMGRCAHLSVELVIDGKDAKGKDITPHCFENLYNDPKAVWKWDQFAKSIGIFYEGIPAGEIRDTAPRHIGKAEFIIEEYNGRKRNKVKRFIEAEKGADDLPF